MESIARAACERIRAAGVPCEGFVTYRCFTKVIPIGRHGIITIEEKEDGKSLEYNHIGLPKSYAEKVEMVMKELGVEKYVYVPPLAAARSL